MRDTAWSSLSWNRLEKSPGARGEAAAVGEVGDVAKAERGGVRRAKADGGAPGETG